ncbi:hypothetical protein ABIE21_001639 [Conyzicola nivalis]|uniref:Golgi phosphoprotein 3 (GPP34) n=1 Tax=Conyzicola nivalis TaxID=1477021 RepID=A0ABV2QM66_9MICO
MTAPSGQRLTLTEELVILSFRRDTRKRQSRSADPSGSLMAMFRASLIIELVELGRVGLVARKATSPVLTTFGLRALSSELTGDDAADGLLAEIASGRRSDKALSWWLLDGNTMRAVTDGLVERGLVVERTTSFGPFTRDYRFEPVDVELDNAIRDRFEAVYYRAKEPTDRECLMAAVIHDSNIWAYFGPLTGPAERNAFQSRIVNLAARRRPAADTQLGGSGDDVAGVLSALRAAHSGGGH